MERQLALIDPVEVDWRLDEQTRSVGRRNVAKARQVLAEARRKALDERRRAAAGPHSHAA